VFNYVQDESNSPVIESEIEKQQKGIEINHLKVLPRTKKGDGNLDI
jgi:hypothetical protein